MAEGLKQARNSKVSNIVWDFSRAVMSHTLDEIMEFTRNSYLLGSTTAYLTLINRINSNIEPESVSEISNVISSFTKRVTRFLGPYNGAISRSIMSLGLRYQAVWVHPAKVGREGRLHPGRIIFPSNTDANCVLYALGLLLHSQPTIEEIRAFECLMMRQLNASWLACEVISRELGI